MVNGDGAIGAGGLDFLTEQLRALRLADESAVIVGVGSVSDPGCPDTGAISVTATKAGHTATSRALRLEDALLMVRARLDEAIEREAAEREAARAKGVRCDG